MAGAPQPSTGGSVSGREPDLATAAAPHPTSMTVPVAYGVNPAMTEEPTPEPQRVTGIGGGIRGTSTWYRWHPGEAAAGPLLREFLGSDWRGSVVTVIAPGCTCRPVAVRLTDWCLCRDDRLVDLDVGSFAALADPSRGVIPVIVLEGDWTP